MAGGDNIKNIELNDGLIYMYLVFSAVNILAGVFILVQVCKNWKSAADALNPRQYKLRTPFMISLCVALVGLVWNGAMVLFGTSDVFIAWDYDALGLHMDEIFVFVSLCGAVTFSVTLLHTYIIRLYMVYDFNQYQTYSLYLLQASIVITCIVTPIALTYDGVQLGHNEDQSTGILLLRAKEQILNQMFAFVHLPLYVIGYTLIQLVYQSKLRNISAQKRQQMLAMLVKESFLMLLIGISVIMFFIVSVCFPNPNIFLLFPFVYSIQLLMLYLVLDFNQRVFHRLCYTFSVLYLKYCCACAYQQNDEHILLKVLDLDDEMSMGANDVQYSSVMNNENELTDTTDTDVDTTDADADADR